MSFKAKDFSRFFRSRPAKVGLMLCGAAVAASCFGFEPVTISMQIAAGISAAISHVPFMPTGEAIDAFFEGVKAYTGGLGDGLAQWIKSSGGEIAHRTLSVISEMRNQLGDKVEPIREFFSGIISSGMEAGSVWLTSMRNTIGNNPFTLVEYAGKALVTVAETWGVLKGLQEAYGWASRRFGKSKEAQEGPAAPPAQNITNIHLNIALSDAKDVGAAVEGLVRSVNQSSNPQAITEHMQSRLAPSLPQLTPDSPVVSSDVRAPVKASNDNASDPFDDWVADAPDDSDEAPLTLLEGDDVIWASVEFTRNLHDGLIRSMSDKVTPEQLRKMDENLSRQHGSMVSIDGGIILKMTPKGRLITTPATPRNDADGPTMPFN